MHHYMMRRHRGKKARTPAPAAMPSHDTIICDHPPKSPVSARVLEILTRLTGAQWGYVPYPRAPTQALYFVAVGNIGLPTVRIAGRAERVGVAVVTDIVLVNDGDGDAPRTPADDEHWLDDLTTEIQYHLLRHMSTCEPSYATMHRHIIGAHSPGDFLEVLRAAEEFGGVSDTSATIYDRWTDECYGIMYTSAGPVSRPHR